MKITTLVALSVLFLLNMACVNTHVQLYSSPKLPRDQIVIVENLDFHFSSVDVDAIDGDSLYRFTRIGPFKDVWRATKVELLPGLHKFEISYYEQETVPLGGFAPSPWVARVYWRSISSLIFTCQLESGNTYRVWGTRSGTSWSAEAWVWKKGYGGKYEKHCGPFTL